jgi:hypothetical protein
VVILVEVSRKAYLASIVPVIVNSILNEHQIVIDIVAFVNKGDFPRSRLGEKQRGKILAGWVTRKMRTVAQFAIRDMEAGAMDAHDGSVDAHRASVGSMRSSGVPGASSLRNMSNAPQILEQEELDHQMDRMAELPPAAELPVPAKDERSGPMPPRIDTGGGLAATGTYTIPDFDQFGDDTPTLSARPQSTITPVIRLPGVDGREPEMVSPTDGRVELEDNWTRDAIMHMNLASQMGKHE